MSENVSKSVIGSDNLKKNSWLEGDNIQGRNSADLLSANKTDERDNSINMIYSLYWSLKYLHKINNYNSFFNSTHERIVNCGDQVKEAVALYNCDIL